MRSGDTTLADGRVAAGPAQAEVARAGPAGQDITPGLPLQPVDARPA